MTYAKVVAAHKTMRKIYNVQLPVRAAYKVYQMIRQIEVPFGFYIERNKALMEEYGGTIRDNDFVFPTQEDLLAYRQGLQELNDTEVELEIEPVTLEFSDIDDCKLSPAEIASLDGFIRFEE